MPSGGRVRPKAGKQYPNRSDLRTQPPAAAPNQTYGQAGAQLAAQKQIPLSKSPPPQAAGPSLPAPGNAGSGGPQAITPLSAPTARPNEPITAGLPTGAGPGPEALGLPQQPSEDQNISAVLHGLYQAYPNPDLARLIASLDNR